MIEQNEHIAADNLVEITPARNGALNPDCPLEKKCVIPAKAGIQMIKNFPRKWDNIMILTASR